MHILEDQLQFVALPDQGEAGMRGIGMTEDVLGTRLPGSKFVPTRGQGDFRDDFIGGDPGAFGKVMHQGPQGLLQAKIIQWLRAQVSQGSPGFG